MTSKRTLDASCPRDYETLTSTTSFISSENKELINTLKSDLIDTLREEWWIWLAASQIWELKSMFIINVKRIAEKDWSPSKELKKLTDENGFLCIINWIIQAQSEQTESQQEMCISIPWQIFEVTRPREVIVSFINEAGTNFQWNLKWLLARAYQHEHDHTKGEIICNKWKKIENEVNQ